MYLIVLTISILAASIGVDGEIYVNPNGTIWKQVGEIFVAYCNDEPDAKWYHNGSIIQDEGRNTHGLKLQISDVTFNDEGMYSCSNGISNDDLFLRIFQKPTFINNQPEQTLTFGQTGRIMCNVDIGRNELSHCEWKKNGMSITESEKFKIKSLEHLEIAAVEQNDAGNYTCIVIIEGGPLDVTQAKITVHISEGKIHTTRALDVLSTYLTSAETSKPITKTPGMKTVESPKTNPVPIDGQPNNSTGTDVLSFFLIFLFSTVSLVIKKILLPLV